MGVDLVHLAAELDDIGGKGSQILHQFTEDFVMLSNK